MDVKSPILRKHFEKNGFDADFFMTYESETTDELQDIDKLCSTLYDIREKKSKIVIYTDFDVDGIMSSVIAYAGLSELGFNVALFKPSPSDGYGFRVKDVDDIYDEYPDVAVIFTGDVGIGCNEAIEYAQSKGLKVFVTDHHTESVVCTADIAVNPNRICETYSHNYICGSYVVYKVIELFAKKYCGFVTQADIYRLQMFAGIATISDVMPLIYENRQLVRNSVSLMQYFYNYQLVSDTIAPPTYSANYMRAFVGMKKLLEYFTEIGKIKKAADIDEQFYSFYLIPFLNSAKRMNGDMRGIYDIFFSSRISPAKGFENMACVENGIKYIDILSARRRELTAAYFNALSEEKQKNETENAAFMQCEVYITDATAGLLGLLGSKFAAMSGMPTLVVNEMPDGSYMGSGRNPNWFDFAGQLQAHNIDIECNGHKEAFGVFIPNKSVLLDYIAFYQDYIVPEYVRLFVDGTLKSDTYISISYQNCVSCDFVFDGIMIKEYIDEMMLYHPYGHAFPEPKFKYYLNLSSAEIKIFGSEKQHAKIITEDGMEILLFNMSLELNKLISDNSGTNFIIVCYGIFRYDKFNTQFDTINFLANDIAALSE